MQLKIVEESNIQHCAVGACRAWRMAPMAPNSKPKPKASRGLFAVGLSFSLSLSLRRGGSQIYRSTRNSWFS